MKILPLYQYKTPDYPTMAAARLNPELLSRIPRRWKTTPGFVAMLGVFSDLATRVALTAELPHRETDTKITTALTPSVPRPVSAKSEATNQVRQATSVVAPFLDEALKYDGRGSFGCVAVNPPTFLSEDEAIELIRTELEAAGLKLKEDVDLDNVETPLAGTVEGSRSDGGETDGKTNITNIVGSTEWPRYPPRLAPQAFAFDLADTDRSVFIEYLSLPDHKEWAGPSGSSVTDFDFPTIAKRAATSFQRVSSDRRLVFGIFFDPLARVETPSPDVSNLTDAQRRLALLEYRKALNKEQANLDDKVRDKLRKQVRNFVVFLNQEGIIAKTK